MTITQVTGHAQKYSTTAVRVEGTEHTHAHTRISQSQDQTYKHKAHTVENRDTPGGVSHDAWMMEYSRSASSSVLTAFTVSRASIDSCSSESRLLRAPAASLSNQNQRARPNTVRPLHRCLEPWAHTHTVPPLSRRLGTHTNTVRPLHRRPGPSRNTAPPLYE